MDQSVTQRRLRSVRRPTAAEEPEPFTWMTYDEIAGAFAIGRDSARRLALRRGWRRTLGNDGMARIAVADAELAKRKRKSRPASRPGAKAAAAHAELLRRVEQLSAACQRADDNARTARAETQAEQERSAALRSELAATRQKADAAAAHVAGLTLRLAMETSRREDLQVRIDALETLTGELDTLRREATAAASLFVELSCRFAMEEARREDLQTRLDAFDRQRCALRF